MRRKHSFGCRSRHGRSNILGILACPCAMFWLQVRKQTTIYYILIYIYCSINSGCALSCLLKPPLRLGGKLYLWQGRMLWIFSASQHASGSKSSAKDLYEYLDVITQLYLLLSVSLMLLCRYGGSTCSMAAMALTTAWTQNCRCLCIWIHSSWSVWVRTSFEYGF